MSNNRKGMEWVRNAHQLKTSDSSKKRWVAEYEIGSECHIPDLFYHPSGAFTCAMYTMNADEQDLHHYLLQIHHVDSQKGHGEHMKEWEKADGKGYSFPGGEAEELLALFSIHFRTRFYLLSRSFGELTENSIKVKDIYPLARTRCRPGIHPHIFSQWYEIERSWATGLGNFMEKAQSLPEDLHRKFALACSRYHSALRKIGVDSEMVYIHLVSAIECLMPDKPIDIVGDPFFGMKLDQLCKPSELSEEAFEEIRNWFSGNRRKKWRFIRFVAELSDGYVPEVADKTNILKVTKSTLETYLKAIYDARSGYLHEGKTMYIPTHPICADWDFLPSGDRVVDQQRWKEKDRLPYPHFFEGLVRHTIIKFLDMNTMLTDGAPRLSNEAANTRK